MSRLIRNSVLFMKSTGMNTGRGIATIDTCNNMVGARSPLLMMMNNKFQNLSQQPRRMYSSAEDTSTTKTNAGTTEKDGETATEQQEQQKESTANNNNGEIETLKTKLAEKEKQVVQLQDAYRRSLADMENLRQRTRKEVEQTQQFAIQKFAKELLDISDVLQMALDSTPKDALKDNKPLNDLHQGVSLTKSELLKCFKRFGVESFESTGEKFDPNMHQALYRGPSNQYGPGIVMQTVKIGYTLNGRVLRPAQVGVVTD